MTRAARHPENSIDYLVEDVAPLGLVEVEPLVNGHGSPLADELRDTVVISVIHSGDVIPPAFLVDRSGETIQPRAFYDEYVRERDWGAAMVARALAERLGLAGYHRVTIARVLLDFGRFPGPTPRGAVHMERLAINQPFSSLLSHHQKRHLLSDYYDVISDGLERAVRGRLIHIAVHTYDRYNPWGSERPECSVITRSAMVERDRPGYITAFDELFPTELGEFTGDPVLRDRISLTMQKRGLFVEHNYPYSLPEGSIEVRAQVWSFFVQLRQLFEAAHPETAGQRPYRMAWDMLMDTNLRNAESEMLRSYLHMFRRVPPESEPLFQAARDAYIEIGRFLRRDRGRIVAEVRDSPGRLNSIGIEVRKDLLWEVDERCRPVRPMPAAARQIADGIAEGVVTYLERDRPRS